MNKLEVKKLIPNLKVKVKLMVILYDSICCKKKFQNINCIYKLVHKEVRHILPVKLRFKANVVRNQPEFRRETRRFRVPLLLPSANPHSPS